MPSDSLIAHHSWTGGSANTTLFWVGYLWHCGKACANAFTSLVTYMSGLACIHVQVHKPHVLWVLDLNLHSSTSKSNKLSKWAKSRAIAWMHITHTHQGGKHEIPHVFLMRSWMVCAIAIAILQSHGASLQQGNCKWFLVDHELQPFRLQLSCSSIARGRAVFAAISWCAPLFLNLPLFLKLVGALLIDIQLIRTCRRVFRPNSYAARLVQSAKKSEVHSASPMYPGCIHLHSAWASDAGYCRGHSPAHQKLHIGYWGLILTWFKLI